MKGKLTICNNLEIIYRKAVADKRINEATIIKDCYIMAKKMHKRLLEYKYNGNIPEECDTTEEQWLNELDKVIKKDSNEGFTRNCITRKF